MPDNYADPDISPSPISLEVKITKEDETLVYGPKELSNNLRPQVYQVFYWGGIYNDGEFVDLGEEYTVTFTLSYDDKTVVRQTKVIPVTFEQLLDDEATVADPVNAQRGAYDLTKSDLNMPVRDGVNLVRSYFNNREEGRIQNDYELLFPFGVSEWTHNYVKYLKIPHRSVTGRLLIEVKDGNENRDIGYYIDTDGSMSEFQISGVERPHNGLERLNEDVFVYKKSNGIAEYYERSQIKSGIALVTSVERFGQEIFKYNYKADTLKSVVDRWGNKLEFSYKQYNIDRVGRYKVSLLYKVQISGREDWIEYQYKEFELIPGEKEYRLIQVVKHSDGKDIVLDRYYYGGDKKRDLVTHVLAQGAYSEDNETSRAAYEEHRGRGFRINNWYEDEYNWLGEGKERIYYQETVNGDELLSKIYIKRFRNSLKGNVIDSIYIYHWENPAEKGAHDPLNDRWTPEISGDYYLEIIRYNTIGNRKSITEAGKTTEYLEYDDDYNPIRVKSPDGKVMQYEYYSYYADGRVRYSPYETEITYANGDFETYTYSQPESSNPYYIRLESITDEMARRTEYTYDENNYPDIVILAGRRIAGLGTRDIVNDYDYNSVGNLIKIVDPEGKVTDFAYNNSNNGPYLMESQTGDDIVTTYSYNELGKIEQNSVRKTEDSIDVTDFEYDEMGNLSKITHPDGSFNEFEYDKAENLRTNKVNGLVTHEYNYYPNGDLYEVVEDGGGESKYKYNMDSKLIEFTNANGKTILYNYDNNELKSVDYPDGTSEIFTYYPDGLLRIKQDRNGEEVEFTYDARDRIQSKTYTAKGVSIDFQYNKVGEVIALTDKTGSIIYARDDMGNIEKTEIYDLYTKEYTYDLSNRKTGFKAYEANNPLNIYMNQSWLYDNVNGRLQSSTFDGSTIELEYYDNNALKQINHLGVNLKEVYNIGNRGEILDVRFKNPSDVDLSVVEYEYDDRLNRTSQSINLPNGATESISYEYDNLDRLTDVSYSNLSKTVVYSYDDLGNRETMTENGATINYTYNKDNNHLNSISTGESYTYNDRGDMMSSNGTSYSYDEEGRLTSVSMGDSTLEFLYSAEGKRIRKISRSNSNVDTTYYLYDGMNAVVELDGDLNKKKSYSYIGVMLVITEDNAGNKHYYSHDGLGSIIAIFDASGSYVNVYMYDEFGNFLQKLENVSNNYYYTGQELDGWSGLYNLRNRYYNASLGRFTQLDPIADLLSLENMQELNGYTYVANNPMILIDLFGLCGGLDNIWIGALLIASGEVFFGVEGGSGAVLNLNDPNLRALISTRGYKIGLGAGGDIGLAVVVITGVKDIKSLDGDVSVNWDFDLDPGTNLGSSIKGALKGAKTVEAAMKIFKNHQTAQYVAENVIKNAGQVGNERAIYVISVPGASVGLNFWVGRKAVEFNVETGPF